MPVARPEKPPRFIAEISSNHACDLGRCHAFIDAAAKAGCWGVKFQLFRVTELFAPEILARSTAHRHRTEWELPIEFLSPIAEHCQAAGVAFGCTPFHLGAVEQLRPHVQFLKIASYELLWHDLLRACARTGIPVILSTGMASLEEVDSAVTVLRASGCREPTLLHCVSDYPAPARECNLAAIETMRTRFELPVGWSDHSTCPGVLQRAVHRWNAKLIEFHLDLDGAGEEFETGHCWLPEQIAPVIHKIREGIAADGTGDKQATPVERSDRDWRADPVDGLRPLRRLRAGWKPASEKDT